MEEISEKEKERRRKLSEYRKKVLKEKREKGYREYIKRKHKEKLQKEKEKAKEKAKKEKERLKLANKPKPRKVGRPKKRGPKKKRKRTKVQAPKINIRNTRPPYLYKVISCRNGTQNKFIGKYRTIQEAYEVFNKLKEEESLVIFPRMESVENSLKNSIDEYLIIEKNDAKNSILRNEYGKFVEQKTNIKGWIVLDKYKYHGEESFWVWGYSPKNDRKDFKWIYNLICTDNSIFNYKRIIIYKNKLIIKYDDDDIDIVFCKSESDSIRLYNKLEEWIRKDKVKYVMFIGSYSEISERRRKLEDIIMSKTKWTRKKVQMKNTTYYSK